MLPIHLNLGFRVSYFYEGFYFLVAIVVAYLWARHRIAKTGTRLGLPVSLDVFHRGLIGVLIGSIVGARLSHFLFWEPQRLLSDPLVFFRVWEGGLSVTGGLILGILGGYIALRGKKADFGSYFALVSPTVLLGQAVGRIGCFLNGDAYGAPTNLPWGVSFPRHGHMFPSGELNTQIDSFAWSYSYNQGLVDAKSTASVPLHPAQLYEAFGDLAIMALVLIVWRQVAGGYRRRSITWLHIACYCLLRWGLEFIRADRDVPTLATMTGLQWVLLAGTIASAIAFFITVYGPDTDPKAALKAAAKVKAPAGKAGRKK